MFFSLLPLLNFNMNNLVFYFYDNSKDNNLNI